MKTTTKERPIIFSGPMVRAILAGKKRQTRRVIKPQPESPRGVYDVWPEDTVVEPFSDGTHWGFRWSKQQHGKIACDFRDSSGLKWKCPYGQPGDVLWVKETWAVHGALYDDLNPSRIRPPEDMKNPSLVVWGCHKPGDAIWYRQHSDDTPIPANGCRREYRGKWRSSLFMPRWASRLRLLLKSVRVERVQDISEADAMAEGVDGEAELVCSEHCLHRDVEGDHLRRWREDGDDGYLCPTCGEKLWHHPIDECHSQGFRRLWDSINGKKYPWASNPWVWVLEFERVQG